MGTFYRHTSERLDLSHQGMACVLVPHLRIRAYGTCEDVVFRRDLECASVMHSEELDDRYSDNICALC